MAKRSLKRDKKFALLLAILKLPEPYVRGHLELLWEAGHDAADPNVGTTEVVEAITGWQGESGVLVKALVRTGFLDARGDEFEIHNFWDHAPHFVKDRLWHRQRREGSRSAEDGSLEPPPRRRNRHRRPALEPP